MEEEDEGGGEEKFSFILFFSPKELCRHLIISNHFNASVRSQILLFFFFFPYSGLLSHVQKAASAKVQLHNHFTVDVRHASVIHRHYITAAFIDPGRRLNINSPPSPFASPPFPHLCVSTPYFPSSSRFLTSAPTRLAALYTRCVDGRL